MIEALDALLETVRAGTGALIVVEGDTPRDDPWFYSRWFGGLRLEVRFIHQDGYRQVRKAVAYLREHEPNRPVFGLIDRDFTSRDKTDATASLETGLYRTGWYTLENYFLADLDAWLRILDMLTAGAPPPGWSTPEELQARILDAYRISLPVAAWNRVVCDEFRRTVAAGKTPDFCEHHSAITDKTLATLTQWGESRSAPIDLADLYRDRLAALLASPEAWPELVTGKTVFKRFAEAFPELRNAHEKTVKLSRMYMGQQPQPPPDLAAIVDEIRREAAKLRRPGA